MLIDLSYYIGELNIPNTSNPGVAERLNFLTEKYEEDLLRSLLGNALYYDFTENDSDDRWTELLQGREQPYTDVNGRQQRWRGLINEDKKQSAFALYTYYWWQRDRVTITTEIGEIITEADKTESKGNANLKMARAWNEMVDWNNEMILFIRSNKEIYPEWEWCFVHSHLLKPINVFNF